jgi:hypothetical protein
MIRRATRQKRERNSVRRKTSTLWCAKVARNCGKWTHTACPPRRSFVASDARRRGQATPHRTQITTAFGAVLHTPAILAGVHNTVGFTMIADT